MAVSGNQFVDDFAVDVCQSEISAGVAESKFFVVEADEFEECGVQVVDVNGFFNGFEAEFIGCSVSIAAADSAACKPHGEAPVIMISSVDFSGVGTFGG